MFPSLTFVTPNTYAQARQPPQQGEPPSFALQNSWIASHLKLGRPAARSGLSIPVFPFSGLNDSKGLGPGKKYKFFSYISWKIKIKTIITQILSSRVSYSPLDDKAVVPSRRFEAVFVFIWPSREYSNVLSPLLLGCVEFRPWMST